MGWKMWESFFWTPLTSFTLNPIDAQEPMLANHSSHQDFWRCSTISNYLELKKNNFSSMLRQLSEFKSELSCRWKKWNNFLASKAKALSSAMDLTRRVLMPMQKLPVSNLDLIWRMKSAKNTIACRWQENWNQFCEQQKAKGAPAGCCCKWKLNLAQINFLSSKRRSPLPLKEPLTRCVLVTLDWQYRKCWKL